MKNFNIKVILGIILVTVVVLLGVMFNRKTLVNSQLTTVYDVPVKIGVLLPLSGTSAVIGQNVKIGVDKALAEVNSGKQRFEVVYEDNKNDPKEAVIATQKLIDIDKVDMIVTTMSGASLAVVPIAKAKNIPVIGTVVYVDITKNYSNSFQMFVSPQKEADAFINSINSLNIKKVSILYTNNDYGIAEKDAIKNSATEKGVQIIDDEGYALTETSFKTELLKLKQGNPDTILLVTFPQNVVIQLKEIKELGIKSKIIINTPVYLNGMIGSNELLNGTYVMVPKTYGDVKNQEISLAKYGTKYPAGNAYIPYDVIKLIAEKYTSTKTIISDLAKEDTLNSEVNGSLSVDKVKRAVNFELTLMKIEGGELKEIEN